MINVKTYNYSGERNRVDKTDMLTATEDFEGALNASFDILRPVVRFRVNAPVVFNYAQIPILGNRYYFVDTIKQEGNICTVTFSVDVLNTYKTSIKKLSGTLIQGENTDKYVSVRDSVYDVRPHIKRLDFPNSGLFNETGDIVMVTIKGDK